MTQPPDGDRHHPQPPESYPAPPPGSHAPPPGSYAPPPGSYAPPSGSYAPPPGSYAPPPGSDPGGPPHQPPEGPPAPGAPLPGRPSRGLMILGVVLAAALVLSGISVGAWLLLRDTDRDGAPAPVDAVDAFLAAVYRDLDAGEASAMVCSEARDEDALETKVGSIRAYEEAYADPRFIWDEPEVIQQTDELAIVAVTVTMITGQEQTADQELRVSVLDKEPHGWWVCNVESVTEDDADPEDGDDGDGDGDGDDGDGDEDPDADEDDAEDE